MNRLARWWRIRLLRWRGWPDPEASLDWLEHRRAFLEQRNDASERTTTQGDRDAEF